MKHYILFVFLIFLIKNGYSQTVFFNKTASYFGGAVSLIITDSSYKFFGSTVNNLTNGQYNLFYQELGKDSGDFISYANLLDSFNSYYPYLHGTIRLSDSNYLTAGTVVHYSSSRPGYGSLTKFTPNFDTLWHREFPDWDSIRPSDTNPWYSNRLWVARELPSGDFICIGDYYRGYGYETDGYLMKVDRMGNYLWHKTLTQFNGRTLELGDSGSVYVIGTYWGLKIAKFDSLGNQVWFKIHNTSDIMYLPTQMVKTLDSCIVVPYSRVYKTDGTDDWSHIRVVKIRQKDGQLVWSKYFMQNFDNEVNGIKQLPDGSFIIYGKTGYENPWDLSLDRYYGLLLKISSSGDSLWSRLIRRQIIPLYDEQSFVDLQLTEDSGFIAAGVYEDPYLTYSTPWFVKMNSLGCTDPNCLDTLIGSAEMLQFKDEFLVVYPNPVQDILKVGINVQNLQIEQINIYDMGGRLVLSKEIRSPSTQIDVSSLISGIYIIEVIDMNGKVSSKKFVRE